MQLKVFDCTSFTSGGGATTSVGNLLVIWKSIIPCFLWSAFLLPHQWRPGIFVGQSATVKTTATSPNALILGVVMRIDNGTRPSPTHKELPLEVD